MAFSKCRINQRGGGVVAYVKDNLQCEIFDFISVPPELEMIWLLVSHHKIPRAAPYLIIGCVYIPPESPHQQLLIEHIESTVDIIRTHKPQAGIMITGDFNRTEIKSFCSDSNLNQFGRWMQSQTWSDVFDAPDTQSKTNNFYRSIDRAIKKFFPTKTLKLHNTDKKWITAKIKELIAKRQRAHVIGDLENRNIHRNLVRKEIIKAKNSYNVNKVRYLQKVEPGRWHRQVKWFSNMNRDSLTIHVPGINQGDHIAIANVVNKHLTSHSQSQNAVDTKYLPAYLPCPVPPTQFHPWEIYEDLKRVSVSKSTGPDGISQKVLKACAYEFSVPVTHIINSSLAQGKVPLQWKLANVIPLPKQTPHSINKLRPISLTSTLAKIAEKRVSRFVIDTINPFINQQQYGNQKGVSTTHCLIDVYNFLMSNCEKRGSICTLVLTDFTKAFDLIDHRIAFNCLYNVGISPSILQWVVDFLSNRKQRCKYKNCYSDWEVLTGGVPQGTILAPIIFLCIINSALNDVPIDGDVHVWKYVDDLTLGESRLVEGQCSLQAKLDSLSVWSHTNKIKRNPSKSTLAAMMFQI
ncbi:uncharacterized protein LOC117100361 [Anneissia japonica]|uniref:uncharacterized protein LOC117100361 n=1 Tax=Anneissia japonica TaxID=1529436 RepID=UPI0014256B24|nr:uncharacterized protein LOC117100361 [Anneissia japonica]